MVYYPVPTFAEWTQERPTIPLSAVIRRLIVLLIIAALFCWVFSDVLFHDRNLIYRDAGHFYYPLLKLVQEEWSAGRWPLWNPYENAGMPLLANPASAVLYPPRIVLFQWLPMSYGTAYKWYILLHVLLSAATAYAMARHWKASEWAAGAAALSYAFGAVVMFQYCNVIFLVGAAWVPLGLLATDRALERGDWRWATVLGIVLSMQTLGGDPEAAYLTGVLAALYVALLDRTWAVGLITALCFVAATRVLLDTDHQAALRAAPDRVLGQLLLGVLALVLVILTTRWVRMWRAGSEPARLLVRRTGALVVAAVVAAGLSAVQWIPSWEFNRLSVRAAPETTHDRFAFWVAPWRLLEAIWPNVSGRQFPQHTRWIDIFNVGDRIWGPSLYVGALPVVLAIAVWGVRRCPAWHRWISVTLLLSVWAAAGPAGGPSWYLGLAARARAAKAPAGPPAANQKGQAKTQDLSETPEGGLYWLMVHGLPGFDTFRYPAKLMTFAAAALAALTAVGWDRLFRENCRRAMLGCAAIAGLSVALFVSTFVIQSPLKDRVAKHRLACATVYGPLQPAEVMRSVLVALAQTSLGLAAVFAVVRWLRRGIGPESAAALALALVATDLGLANRWMVSTAPQSDLDAVPRVVRILQDAEAASGEEAVPLRIHRASLWSPDRWRGRSSPSRDHEIFRWERDTMQPKYGVPFGVSYTINEGTLEPYDYWWFFAPFYSRLTPVPNSVVYYPRRGFDMWGSKYFVLPHRRVDSMEHRGFVTFLPQSELVAESHWQEDDFQVRRNLNCYPRAWIVHRVIHQSPIRGLAKADRMDIMRQILYGGADELWREPELDGLVQDPRQVAWIEHPNRETVAALEAPKADAEADRCRIVRYGSDRVELEADTAARGVLIVADAYFPGWKVTVDGRPAELLRANRMMRGVALEAGEHRVVFEYDPLSVRVGAMISLASLAVLLSLGSLSWIRGVRVPRAKTPAPIAARETRPPR